VLAHNVVGLKERHRIHAVALVRDEAHEHVPLAASTYEVMVEDAEFLVGSVPEPSLTQWRPQPLPAVLQLFDGMDASPFREVTRVHDKVVHGVKILLNRHGLGHHPGHASPSAFMRYHRV
jgi:hypothetical protein